MESKSLKLYLWSFRNEGCFHEHLTNIILDDLAKALDPRVVQGRGKFQLPRRNRHTGDGGDGAEAVAR